MSAPIWLLAARADIGLREIKGAPTEPRIAAWLKRLGAWWGEDETPWCGVAVAAWMDSCDIKLPKHWYRARGWLDWGIELSAPAVGAVVVYERKGGGHVGLLVGKDHLGRLLTLGGNQGDAVSIAPFDSTRVLGYRWPEGRIADIPAGGLPLLASSGQSSSNEA